MPKIVPPRYLLVARYWNPIREDWQPEVAAFSDSLTDCLRVAATENFDHRGMEIFFEGILDREAKRFIFPDELDRLVAEYRADIEADAEHEAREAQIIRSQR